MRRLTLNIKGPPSPLFHRGPRCPVCGVRGYRKITRVSGEEAIYYCRRGHPHYVPMSLRARRFLGDLFALAT